MFHSLTIHRGRDNVTQDRIRLATSARYQSVSEPVDEAALGVHLGCAKWEDVYSGWETNDSLKYYWNAIDIESSQLTIAAGQNPLMDRCQYGQTPTFAY